MIAISVQQKHQRTGNFRSLKLEAQEVESMLAMEKPGPSYLELVDATRTCRLANARVLIVLMSSIL